MLNAKGIIQNFKEIGLTVTVRSSDLEKWSASVGRVEIKKRGILSSCFGHGINPETAVWSLWYRATDLEPGEYLVIDAGTKERRAFRWNNNAWMEVHEWR
jgi:hypothetical protein